MAPTLSKSQASGTAKVSDVLVGEVWICSGQSNMEWVLANSLFRNETKAQADPAVRMFTVTKKVAQVPQEDVQGSWVASATNTVDSFSAVGLAFANKLRKELNVPIGMIHTSWGGTPAEAWTPRTIFSEIDQLPPTALRRNMLGSYQQRLAASDSNMESVLEKIRPGGKCVPS